MLQNGSVLDVAAYNYLRGGFFLIEMPQVHEAIALYRQVKDGNVHIISYNTLISGLCGRGT